MPRPVDPIHCTRAEELLEAFLDGELRNGETAELKAHLARCPRCRGELELSRSVQGALRALPELDPPPRVRRQALATAAAESGPTTRRWPWLVAAAAFILAVLIPVLSGPLRQPTVAVQDPELARAIHDSRLALALVASVSRRTGSELRKETLAHRLVEPAMDQMLRPLQRRPAARSENNLRIANPDNPPTRSSS